MNAPPGSPPRAPVRVLVVDDSAVMRALLQHRLTREADIEVVGCAANATEARALIKALDPDVVTLDIEMPGMDGLSFLEKIMTLRPTPVIIVSSATEAGASATARALSLGAVDCYAKSELQRGTGHDDRGALARMVREAASVRRGRPRPRPAPPNPSTAPRERREAAPELIAIGASTGGVEALHSLLARFPADCPPTLVVQHVNACFAPAIVQSLGRVSRPRVMLGESDLPLARGTILLAPGDAKHMLVGGAGPRGSRCVLRAGDPVSGHRPSVDMLFQSVAERLGPRACGVLLTGMGRDGAEGLAAMRRAGAHTIAQDEESCVVFGMPRAAIALGAAREILPLASIAEALYTPEEIAR
ncbi:chemotaxis response regulator protein-glutamate methylesterase [Erythrobacter sp. HL-111]|uniref:protein-glutamate methylesterase/protein-glutamine glutaminase n=1 Tax=Erythrobacter sp. HL-111 TaxID=1798193 RepID=UPI0006D9D601|nr:chemotaxis response regulator protein-glutamate methylesterase [Erythrobacter sp. HL-111]KPP96322.1 MAG: two-component system, chemotaxis family, response regulator CheB [Erythrobacteraceae bacterium HL-111]SDR73476.1 two-component system, chemotaxis family, response regulator CheB [Erythrobacter sp. HL-111]